MPLRIVRGPTNGVLWEACAARFLEAVPEPGPGPRRAWLWYSHPLLRDRLLDAARARGIEGWLDPPLTYLGDLPELFGIREPPAGLLTRRRLLGRAAARRGREILGRDPASGRGVARGHMLDAELADLLPEGVGPETLEEALSALEGDGFAGRRDRWVVEAYRDYLAELSRRGLWDWRSANARIARRIEGGELSGVLRGAARLHLYGMTNLRTRRRLLRALARQEEVSVELYRVAEPEPDPFLEGLASEVETLEGPEPSAPLVQPAPDAAREMAWVAREVKRLLSAEEAEPHEVTVVARSGRDDARRALRSLRDAGVPATARVRTPLAEVPALKALLLLFRGAAREWDYRSLRAVLDHPCFETGVDLRGVDLIAGRRRVRGLAAWEEALAALVGLVEEGARETRGKGLDADRARRDLAAFRRVREALEPLSEPRTERGWIDLALRLLREGGGILGLRRRVCDPVPGRPDVVRLDQRGILQVERLLAEWRELEPGGDALDPAAWTALLVRLLEGSELALSTPRRTGVQVLEAHEAALLPFSHTFLVHANDGEFPRAGRASGVLSDEERARLARLGIPLSHREEALRRERTLWRAVTAQAAGVRIGYRTTDPGGTPLLPSLLVPEHDPGSELPRARTPREEGDPVSEGEADRRAAFRLRRALAGGGPEAAPGAGEEDGGREPAPGGLRLAPARPGRLRQAILAAVAESGRGAGLERSPAPEGHPALRPHPWNGEIRDPEVLRFLEERFGEGYLWSASQLERYARAPFLFLLDRVLRLEGIEEVEEETSPLAFGSVTHEILERFYREHLGAAPAALDDQAAARLAAIVREVCDRREAEEGTWLGLPALWSVTREKVGEAVRDYLAWELPVLAESNERPVLAEEGFGEGEEEVWLAGTDLHGRPARLRLRGRIDRVDATGGEEPLHHVLDYKSGGTPSARDFDDGTALQGVLYMEALAEGRGLAVGSCRYRSIRKPGAPKNGGRVTFGSERHEAALRRALAIPARVRAGRFEAVLSRRGRRWKDWDPGLEIRRSGAVVGEGDRFERDGEASGG